MQNELLSVAITLLFILNLLWIFIPFCVFNKSKNPKDADEENATPPGFCERFFTGAKASQDIANDSII